MAPAIGASIRTHPSALDLPLPASQALQEHLVSRHISTIKQETYGNLNPLPLTSIRKRCSAVLMRMRNTNDTRR